jgi:hypothetical protein
MIILNHKELKEIFRAIHQNPTDMEIKGRLVAELERVIKLTGDRFPQYVRDDMAQELSMSILKKADYIATMFCEGKIDNITNYVFRYLHNAAIIYYKKEANYHTKFVSIDELNIDKAFIPTNQKKQEVIERIREEVTDFVKIRFPNKRDADRALKYVECILEGQRPSFNGVNVRAFYRGKDIPAKEAYSVVLQEVRRRMQKYTEELLS